MEEQERMVNVYLKQSRRDTHLNTNRLTLDKVDSFSSFTFFKDKESAIFNPVRSCNKALLQGPRKLLRLCLFGLLLPVFLISVPLYVRLILYPPYQVSFAPSDQRLLNRHASSFWCQSQSVHMNGSFNAYMLPDEPKYQRNFQTHRMVNHMILKDDYKEYWGFFLHRGSIVKIDLCNRYDGGSLMIMRGMDNLRKCSWITQEDSAEEDEDLHEESNESEEGPAQLIQEAVVLEHKEFDSIGTRNYKENRGRIKNQTKLFIQTSTKTGLSEVNITSAERKDLLDLYVQKILKLSKASREITDSFFKQNFSLNRKLELTDDELPTREALESLTNYRQKNWTKVNHKNGHNSIQNEDKKQRFKRAIQAEIPDEGKEIEDEPHEGMKLINLGNMKVESTPTKTQVELYSKIFKLPEGLEFEKGIVNSSTGMWDNSNEEHRSSFSSSEEALANCEGLLGAVPLYADPFCTGKDSAPSNKITYRVPITGTYYFVFSSDNEITDSDMYFNMTLLRVVYDTGNRKESCFNKTDCSLAFSFWSHDQAVIEVPSEGNDWNSSYVLDSVCEPRVPVYLCIIILVPIVILFCALQ